MSHDQVRVGVAALVRRKDGALLMGLRKGEHGAGTWAFPGGHLEYADASVVDGALRELREETSIVAFTAWAKALPHTTYTHFPDVSADGGGARAYITLYVAIDLPENVLRVNVQEPEMHAEWRWIAPGQGWPGPLFRPLEHLLDLGVDPWLIGRL